jgi:chromosome segregation ATPase
MMSLQPPVTVLFSLFLASQVQVCDAWIPSSTSSSLTQPPSIGQRKLTTKKESLLVLSSGADPGVMDFIHGLDSILGNPTFSSTSVLEPAVSNSNILIGGGVVATLSLAGLAVLTLTKGPEEENEDTKSSWSNSQEEREETRTVTSINPDTPEEAVSKQEEEEVVSNQVGEEVEEVRTVVEENNNDGDEQQKSLLAKLRSKLQFKTDELETNEILLEQEKTTRIDIESKLLLSTEANSEITGKYKEVHKYLAETVEKLNSVETQLQIETQQREEIESNLSEAAESNRILEDQYELEQNAKTSIMKELGKTKDSLMTTQKQLKNSRGELISVKAELINANRVLKSTSSSLDQLEEEQRSLGTLGKKMWRLSKSRIINIFKKDENNK